jgi:muramoyltetrapeptide carboxypeptidase
MSEVLRKPRALRAGDAIAVVAPASPFDRESFDAGVREIEALGFRPVWRDDVFDRRAYVAGEARTRAAALTDAWQDAAVAGLIAVRGGYGSVQVLPHLDPAVFQPHAKVVVGYSDITSLLTWLVGTCGVVAFHGPTVAGRLGDGAAAYDRASLLAAVTRTEPMGEMSMATLETLVPGEGRGRLLGGTLTQLAAAAGTPYALQPWDDTILLLEDVGERPYRIDRLVQQLRLSGLFARVRGIVCGTFPRCDEPDSGLTARAVLADLFADFRGPVVFGCPTGHVDGPAITVPLGVAVRLDATTTPRFIIEEAAVA